MSNGLLDLENSLVRDFARDVYISRSHPRMYQFAVFYQSSFLSSKFFADPIDDSNASSAIVTVGTESVAKALAQYANSLAQMGMRQEQVMQRLKIIETRAFEMAGTHSMQTTSRSIDENMKTDGAGE